MSFQSMSFAALLAVVPAAAWGAPEAFEREVDEAIDGGVENLLKAVVTPAGWIPEEKFPAGYAALQLYALLKSDVSYQHPLIQKGLAVLEDYKFEKVYSVALYLMVHEAIIEQIDGDLKLGGSRGGAERARSLERMNSALGWLLDARLQGQGAWNYEPPPPKADPRTFRFDHSNTQFAALALGVAAERKLKVPTEVWLEIADHFAATQDKEGEAVEARPVFRASGESAGREKEKRSADGPSSEPAGKTTTRRKVHPLYQPVKEGEKVPVRARGWRYTRDDFESAKFSMVCAGLSSLLLVQRNVPPAALGPGRVEALRRSIRDGYGWLTMALNGNTRPFQRMFGLHYDLYSMEKVGDLGEVVAFGDFPWYEEGVRVLVRTQRRDGGWGPREEDAIGRHSTALALLFLDRATDLGARTRPLVRITSVGGRGAGGAEAPDRRYWIYLPSQKADVPLVRLFRLFRYRPSQKVMKLAEEAVKVFEPERIHELVLPLLAAVDHSPYPTVQEEAKKLLAAVTGVEGGDSKKYAQWAERWAEVVRIGREKEVTSAERLREWLRDSEGTPLKARVIWALERLGAKSALGDLIDLLAAPDPAHREAAYAGVAFLSGQSLPFHPRGTEKVRDGEVRAFREWYAGEKSRASPTRGE